MAFHNIIISIKSVWNKDQNHYYYSIFFEKCFCQLPKNNDDEEIINVLLWFDVSEGIYVNTISESKKCDICHYWYFSDQGFKFKPDVGNGCHDVLMMSMNLSNIGILNIQGAEIITVKKFRFFKKM